MTHNPEAGLIETGLGLSQGDNSPVARKMAALTVRRKCNTHACTKPQTGVCGHDDHDTDVRAMGEVLDMLGLPRELCEPTEEERANLFEHLPKNIVMDMRVIDNLLTPENRLPARS